MEDFTAAPNIRIKLHPHVDASMSSALRENLKQFGVYEFDIGPTSQTCVKINYSTFVRAMEGTPKALVEAEATPTADALPGSHFVCAFFFDYAIADAVWVINIDKADGSIFVDGERIAKIEYGVKLEHNQCVMLPGVLIGGRPITYVVEDPRCIERLGPSHHFDWDFQGTEEDIDFDVDEVEGMMTHGDHGTETKKRGDESTGDELTLGGIYLIRCRAFYRPTLPFTRSPFPLRHPQSNMSSCCKKAKLDAAPTYFDRLPADLVVHVAFWCPDVDTISAYLEVLGSRIHAQDGPLAHLDRLRMMRGMAALWPTLRLDECTGQARRHFEAIVGLYHTIDIVDNSVDGPWLRRHLQPTTAVALRYMPHHLNEMTHQWYEDMSTLRVTHVVWPSFACPVEPFLDVLPRFQHLTSLELDSLTLWGPDVSTPLTDDDATADDAQGDDDNEDDTTADSDDEDTAAAQTTLARVAAFVAQSKTLTTFSMIDAASGCALPRVTKDILMDMTRWLTTQPVRQIGLGVWKDVADDSLVTARFYTALFNSPTIEVLECRGIEAFNVDLPMALPNVRELRLFHNYAEPDDVDIAWLPSALVGSKVHLLQLSSIPISEATLTRLADALPHTNVKVLDIFLDFSRYIPGAVVCSMLQSPLVILSVFTGGYILSTNEARAIASVLHVNTTLRSLVLNRLGTIAGARVIIAAAFHPHKASPLGRLQLSGTFSLTVQDKKAMRNLARGPVQVRFPTSSSIFAKDPTFNADSLFE
ncbi:Aste57867_20938 [Aphanomyces stellatus]|uniref:Aste57867_20938 protein n=1 Tax=Aphanomyces stellatus TaxID=120398 RepID=A0A485LHG8_9STRA|nr:hypothetical protein As57867_020870 [Aphanomyces stellatus]VFT97615.1 Aste57867_20938 [Aphanomyces stellatus]